MKPMYFKLCHNPANKPLTIPRAALQLSGLADAEELTLQAGTGYILVSRQDLNVREAASTIAQLYGVVDRLMEQLVDASREAAGKLEDVPDPLDELDEEVLDDLLACGADAEGLRFLLEMEELEDE